MYNSNDVATRIKELAKIRKIPLKTMFKDIGLGFNTMSNMKTSMPKADNLAKIADYLDCSVDSLLGRSEKSNNTSFRVFSTTPEQRENARLQRMVTTFEELNTEAQDAVLDYVSYIASQPKNLKNEAEDYSNQMKA